VNLSRYLQRATNLENLPVGKNRVYLIKLFFRQFVLFSVAISGLCLNKLIMLLMTQWQHYVVSQMIATAIVLVWNFLCNRFWTFREACLVRQ